MKINHIDNWYVRSIPTIYELRIYKHTEYSSYGYRYQLFSYENRRYLYTIILKTDSKEEMKMTLDLMGLRIEQVNIIMKKKFNKEIIIPYSVIDLTKK